MQVVGSVAVLLLDLFGMCVYARPHETYSSLDHTARAHENGTTIKQYMTLVVM